MLDFDTQEEKEKVIKKIKWAEKNNRKRKMWEVLRYAAVVIFLIGLGFYFVVTKDQQNKEIESVIAETPSGIKPGIDRAVLTLENGADVILEKGKKVKVNGLSQNGDKLIYKNQSSSNQKALKYNYLTIPRGGQFHIQLSDGTKVWLNSESKLKYPVNFISGNTRIVELIYGEAYFDVSESEDNGGSSFRVHTGIQEIEVLGTQFNIKAYKGERNIVTTLVEGEVAIENGFQKKLLQPSEQSLVGAEEGNIVVQKVSKVFDEIAWKEGYFSFKSKSMKDIMKTLSRWYDMEYVFENPDKESKIFTGVLDRESEIDQILIHIQKTNEINFEIYEKTVIIK